MNSNKISPYKINNDLNNYISSSRNKKKPQSYVAAVTSTLDDSMTRLSTLTNKFKEIFGSICDTVNLRNCGNIAIKLYVQFVNLGYSSLVNRTSNKAAVTLYPESTALPFTLCLHSKDGGDRYQLVLTTYS